jgi:hypothetical protein
MAIPLIGAGIGAAARMAAKKLAKKGAKKTDKELEAEETKKFDKALSKKESKPFKGHALRGSEGRTGKGYRDYETGSPKLSDEFKKGGSVKSSASKRADGIAKKGKTKGKMMAHGGMAKMKSGGAC